MEMFLRHVGVRGMLAIIFSVGIIILLAKGVSVPNQMYSLLGLIIGFYVGGSQPLNGIKRAIQSRKKTTVRRK